MQNTLILFGTGRSGTTIFMEAIFRHPDLAYYSSYQNKWPDLKEINYFRMLFDNKLYRVFGTKPQLNRVSIFNKFIFKPIEGPDVWNHLLKDELDFSRNFLFNTEPSEQKKIIVANYFAAITKIQNKNNFGIKITGPSRLSFMTSIFPKAKYIWLKRNFLSTLNSLMNVNFWQKRNTENVWWEGPYTDNELILLSKYKNDSLVFTALQLKKIIEITNIEISTCQLNLKIVNYEDLVKNPIEILTDTLE
jgi:hypothetical protein